MRVLSVGNVAEMQINKINRKSSVNPCAVPVRTSNVSFYGGKTVFVAGFFAAVLGGAAAILAAPVAVIAGAATLGAVGGASMSTDNEPSNDLERYKNTHEY